MSERQQALCYEDLCELGRVFNEAANLRIGRHYRINEALKEALERAHEYHPNEVVRLRNAVSRRHVQPAAPEAGKAEVPNE